MPKSSSFKEILEVFYNHKCAGGKLIESNKQRVPNKDCAGRNFSSKSINVPALLFGTLEHTKQDFLIKLKIDISFICMRIILFA